MVYKTITVIMVYNFYIDFIEIGVVQGSRGEFKRAEKADAAVIHSVPSCPKQGFLPRPEVQFSLMS